MRALFLEKVHLKSNMKQVPVTYTEKSRNDEPHSSKKESGTKILASQLYLDCRARRSG